MEKIVIVVYSKSYKKGLYMRKQGGFSATFFIIIIVVLVGAAVVGWYVYDSNALKDENIVSSAVSNDTQSKSLGNEGSTTEPTVEYTFPEEYKKRVTSAISFDTLPVSFKQYLAEEIKRSDIKDDCKQMYNIEQGTSDTKFYKGGVGCENGGGAALMWGYIDGIWLSISGTQNGWDCAKMEKYAVPKSFYVDCVTYES
jgi:hypothetical protein